MKHEKKLLTCQMRKLGDDNAEFFPILLVFSKCYLYNRTILGQNSHEMRIN